MEKTGSFFVGIVVILIITLTVQNDSLDGSTIGNSFIRVDALVKFLPICLPCTSIATVQKMGQRQKLPKNKDVNACMW